MPGVSRRAPLALSLLACTPLNARSPRVSSMDAALDASTDVCAECGTDGLGADVIRPPDVCAQGRASCDGDPANGCEAALATDRLHCGECDRRCFAPRNGLARCEAGRCVATCGPAFDRGNGACLPPGAPRLIAPRGGHRVRNHTPTLRWSQRDPSARLTVALCRDRLMTRGCVRHPAAGTSLTVPVPLAPGAWFWQVQTEPGAGARAAQSFVWGFFAPTTASPAEGAPRPARDVNGDGYDDLIVGAPFANAGVIDDVGAVYAYLGGPDGLRATPTWTARGTIGSDGLGAALALGADLTADGFADLAVAAPFLVTDGRRRAGAAELFLGSAEGLVRHRTVEGRASGFGVPLAALGDIDGDGLGDLALVGARGEGEARYARVVLGTPDGPALDEDLRLPTPDPLGIAADIDLNADGFSDLSLCALRAAQRGVCSLYLGGDAGPAPGVDWDLAAPPDAPATVSAVAAGDVNRDGFDDLVIHASALADAPAEGITDVLLLARGGADPMALSLTRAYASPRASDRLGVALSRIGDVNGDGFDDLAVGAPGAREGNGRVSVFYGSRAGLSPTPAWSYEEDTPGTGLGTVLADLGDVNGDGFDDLAVGEPHAVVAMTEGVGRVLVFHGGPMGLPARPTRILDGAARNDRFGSALAARPAAARARA